MLTWEAAALCPGVVLRLLVFLASLPTCPLRSCWHGSLSFLLLDPCHVDLSLRLPSKCHRKCHHKCPRRRRSQCTGHPLLKPPNPALLPLPLPQPGPPPPLWTASRLRSQAMPLHSTSKCRRQATLCPHRWGPTPSSYTNQGCQCRVLRPNHSSRSHLSHSSSPSTLGSPCLRGTKQVQGVLLALILLSRP